MDTKALTLTTSAKYLGLIIDSNLNWKEHVYELSKKISRSIGVLSKLRHFVPTKILIQVYYSIIYPLLTYGIIIWGNTYKTNLDPIYILQKKAIRIIHFTSYYEHTSSFFKMDQLLKLPDIIKFYTTVFMHQYTQNSLPGVFDNFFQLVNIKHIHNSYTITY